MRGLWKCITAANYSHQRSLTMFNASRAWSHHTCMKSTRQCDTHHHERIFLKATQPLANSVSLSVLPLSIDVSAKTYSTHHQRQPEPKNYLDAKDSEIYEILSQDMIVLNDFLTEEEESSLLDEVDRYMKRLRYEFDHWDNAIHGYRETEKRTWNEDNEKIIKRVQNLAFPEDATPLAHVHVLDIAKEGYIKPHVDAVRFCGDTITGMCLLSSCVMRLALEKDSSKFGDVHLPRRSLYIMKGRARYEFTHEVLKEEESMFRDKAVPRDRRISVICRSEPNPAHCK